MKKFLFAILLIIACSRQAYPQITINYVATAGAVADPDGVNANFTALASAALNRTGGTITGNIAVNPGITIDGVDISAVLSGTGTPTFSTVTTSDTGATSLTVGGGITAGTGAVGIVNAAGKIPAISTTYFADVSGANLTNIPAANLTGTIAAISGANVTNLNASNLASGIIPDARLVGAYSNALSFTSVSNSFAGVGTNLTNLNATNLTSGLLPSARLSGTYSAAVTLSNASNAFTGAYTSTDGSAGLTRTCVNFTSASQVVIKNGLITSITGSC